MVEKEKQSRLVEAVLQACRRVEDGIRAHRDGAVCRSGRRWRASPDLPLVRICRCRAPCCGCTWSACCRCSGSQSARRVVPHYVQMRASRLPDAIRVRCNQLSVLCGRLATTGLGETSEHATSATPPLEYLRRLLICATIDKLPNEMVQTVAWTEPVVLMLIDLRRAHFCSAVRRKVFVELAVCSRACTAAIRDLQGYCSDWIRARWSITVHLPPSGEATPCVGIWRRLCSFRLHRQCQMVLLETAR